MKSMLTLILIFFSTLAIYSQKSVGKQMGMNVEQNLKALINVYPYNTIIGFDGRYEGVKGSPRLFDTLISSSLILKGKTEYMNLSCDIDVVRNSMVFIIDSTGELMELSTKYVAELILHKDGKEMIFRTTENLVFDKEIKENKFCQILKDEPWQFIKIPEKEFFDADYQHLYHNDSQYHEFRPASKYFIKGNDSKFHMVQLTRKSLTKLFPEKKSLIESNFNEKLVSDKEAEVILLLNKF